MATDCYCYQKYIFRPLIKHGYGCPYSVLRDNEHACGAMICSRGTVEWIECFGSKFGLGAEKKRNCSNEKSIHFHNYDSSPVKPQNKRVSRRSSRLFRIERFSNGMPNTLPLHSNVAISIEFFYCRTFGVQLEDVRVETTRLHVIIYSPITLLWPSSPTNRFFIYFRNRTTNLRSLARVSVASVRIYYNQRSDFCATYTYKTCN